MEDSLEFSTFVTAIEGGINYWATVEEYRHSQSDWFAIIRDHEDFDSVPQRIDFDLIRLGIIRISEKTFEHSCQQRSVALSLAPYVLSGFERRFAALYYDIQDADTADIVVQMGLFDEVMYG